MSSPSIRATLASVANVSKRASPIVLSPEEQVELERRLSDAEGAARDKLPAPVVDLFFWLRHKLDRPAEEHVALDPEDLAELDVAVAEAEDDLCNGRCITGEEMLARLRAVG